MPTEYLNPPKKCDTCQSTIFDTFVDGQMKGGMWANMCLDCHGRLGMGLGLGRGQKYQRQTSGKFVKIEG